MWFISRPLQRCAPRRFGYHRKAARRFFQPLVKHLEDSSLLSAVITVNSSAESDVRDTLMTLREAIEINNRTLDVAALSAAERALVNGTPTSSDTDTIAFNILGTGVHTISPMSALPVITDPLIIDGYTQPGASPNKSRPLWPLILLAFRNGRIPTYSAAKNEKVYRAKHFLRVTCHLPHRLCLGTCVDAQGAA
jgi:hypothetical protein